MAYFQLCSKWMCSLRQQKQQREPVRESKQQIQHKKKGISWFILAGFVMNKQSISMHWAQSQGQKAGRSKVGSCIGAYHRLNRLSEAIYVGLCLAISPHTKTNTGRTDTENTAGIKNVRLTVNSTIICCRIQHLRHKSKTLNCFKT